MRGFTVALFLVLACIGSGAARANDTPTPSPSPDPNALGRFGYIKPIASRQEFQPEMDDFADAVVRQLQESLPVKVEYLAGAGLHKAVSSGACGDDHLSGLIVTRKEWNLTERAVSVQAELRILDCEGKSFYQTVGTYQEHRNTVFDGQAQVVDVQSKAVARAIQNVLDYKNSHASAWNQLMRTGSVDSSDASATAPPSPTSTATGATTAPH
jgi:hypothetical protein